MSASITPSPAGSRRPSTGQRSPGVPPPPQGPPVSRTSSRHRNRVGTQNAWTAATSTPPYTGPAPTQPYQTTTTPQLHASPYYHQQQQQQQRPYAPAPAQPGTLVVRPQQPPGGYDGSSPQQPGAQQPGQQAGIGSFSSTNPVLPQRKSFKRLILACDGTWQSADSPTSRDEVQIPTNVVHLTRAIKSVSRDGIPQVVFYQSGVGTAGSIFSRVIGGAVASGLADNILEGYYWLCQNWMPGDEIFIIGFSRGAFTARSIGGLVDGVGLLTRDGIKAINVIFKDFQHRGNPHYISPYPDIPFKNKPSASDPRYTAGLERHGLSRLGVKIHAIAVFDTVGSLGIPRIPLLETLRLQSPGVREYTFYDTSLGPRILHAFQALALDEQRASFAPAVWEKTRDNTVTDLRQVWFPGVHANVGGGYADANLSNITLAWMMAQLTPLLDLDAAYILEQARSNDAYYAALDEHRRAWSLGRLYNSLTGIWILGGRSPRSPGMYTRVDPYGVPTDQPLRQTNEYVHASARTRFVLDGTGYRDAGYYRPAGLKDYRLRLTGADAGQGQAVAVWESRKQQRQGRKGGGGPKRVLSEAPLFEVEKRLLGLSPHVEHVVLRPQQAEADLEGRRVGAHSLPATPTGGPDGPGGGGASGRHRKHRSAGGGGGMNGKAG